MRRFGAVFSAAVFIAGVAGIVYPAFIEGPAGTHPPSPTQIVVGLFLEPHLTLAYFMRILCLVVVLISAYIWIVERMYRNLPITVVQTKVKMDFNADYSRVVVRREQILRANQPNVTAYRLEVLPTSPLGRTPVADIQMSLFCHGADISFATGAPLFKGSDDRGYEIIHYFGRKMPYNWYMPMIPAWAMKKELSQMISPIRDSLVLRTQTATYINDFNSINPAMSFVASSYPQRNISMELHFEGPAPSKFYAMRIKNNGVLEVKVDNTNTTSRKISVDSLESETLRLGW